VIHRRREDAEDAEEVSPRPPRDPWSVRRAAISVPDATTGSPRRVQPADERAAETPIAAGPGATAAITPARGEPASSMDAGRFSSAQQP